jgi:putative phosphonate catabolism associated alcohol dehydrogenase
MLGDGDSAAVAAVWHGRDDGFVLRALRLPDLSEGETLVRVGMATICGSDLHTIRGERPTPLPTILGHEMVGTVAAVEGEVTAVDQRVVRPGMRVTWSICTSCGRCSRCTRGMPNKCRAMRKYGHESVNDEWALNGAFATHCHLTSATALVVLPDGVGDALLTPANCATATVVGAVDRAGGCASDVVLVQGCGMLGLTAIAYSRYLGARAVIASDVDTARLDIATSLGATHVATPDALESVVRRVSGAEGVDLVLELSGDRTAVQNTFEMLGVGGRLCLVGSVFPSEPVTFVPESVVRGLHRIIGAHNYTPRDLLAAVAFLADVDGVTQRLLSGMVSPPFRLDDIDQAVAAAQSHAYARTALTP